jgi:hypothetical protein
MSLQKPVEQEVFKFNVNGQEVTLSPQEITKAYKFLEENPELTTALIPINGKLIPIPRNEIVEAYKTLTQPKIKEEIKVEPIKKKKVVEYPRPIPIQSVNSPTDITDYSLDQSFRYKYSPMFSEVIKNRLRYLFKPILTDTRYSQINQRIVFKPKTAIRRKSVYKPKFGIKQRSIYKPRFAYKQRSIINSQDFYSYIGDYDYEPSLIQVYGEDFAPKNKRFLDYNPQVIQESYPVFETLNVGIPETNVEQYAPESSVRIKPITDFEINAKPKPLIVSQTYFNLMNYLMDKVLG